MYSITVIMADYGKFQSNSIKRESKNFWNKIPLCSKSRIQFREQVNFYFNSRKFNLNLVDFKKFNLCWGYFKSTWCRLVMAMPSKKSKNFLNASWRHTLATNEYLYSECIWVNDNSLTYAQNMYTRCQSSVNRSQKKKKHWIKCRLRL